MNNMGFILTEVPNKKTYKQIKTVVEGVYHEMTFDQRVNKFIEQGWQLVRRTVLEEANLLYAELEKEVEIDEKDNLETIEEE